MSRPISRAIGSNPIFRVSSLFGIFPFRLIRDELKMESSLLLYSLGFTFFYNVGYLYYFIIPLIDIIPTMIKERKTFYYTYIILCGLLNVMTYSLVLFCVYFHRNVFIETVDLLDAIEPIFSKLEGNIKTRAKEKRILFKISSITLAVCSLIYFSSYPIGFVPLISFNTFRLTGIALCCEQFNSMVDIVGYFFESSSKFLIRIKHPILFNKLIVLDRIIEAVDKLVSISNKINIIYSIQLLFAISVYYSSVMLCTYNIVVNASSKYESKYWLMFGDGLLALYHFLQVCCLVHSAARANSQWTEFNNVLYRLMVEDKTNRILKNDKLLLHISMKNKIVFTACGFFNLDLALLHSILTSALSYFIILIQFGYNWDYSVPGERFSDRTNITAILPPTTSHY